MRCFSWVVWGGVWVAMMSMAGGEERQITTDAAYNHELDNNDNFSPDDRFLVFDTRLPELIVVSKVIAKVEIGTGKITHLYEAAGANEFGPGVGAVSYAPHKDEVIFIHGPLHPTGVENQYDKHRRVGGIVTGDGSQKIRFADGRNAIAPYTPGALRGGTHRHEYSGDGKWVGFTYNDEVMRAHGLKIGKHLDLRTIGVTKLGTAVEVPATEQFASHGEGFSVLVVVVTPDPKPGSDEISHAASDSWVGTNGYRREDGGKQLARAFVGTVRDAANEPVDELFIVDIPEEITKRGPMGPLEGTETTFPMPPEGAAQRRLTRTDGTKFPGCKGNARSSADGERIAFRMRDERGEWQIFLMSPRGGEPQQATFIEGGVTTDARWHPSGKFLASVAGTKIIVTEVAAGERFGKSRVLIDRGPAPYALVWSHDGKMLAYNRIVPTDGREVSQIFVCDFGRVDSH